MKNSCSIIFSFLFSISILQAQDSIPSLEQLKVNNAKGIVLDENLKIEKDTLQVIDTDTDKVNRLTGELKKIAKTKDSIFYVAADHAQLVEMDSIWKQELYNSSLYDSIYKSISELTYEPVEYVDLPTDTLKARLAELNTRTPFNVEYNPSLESVIKRYLKKRHKQLERLMALSEFYFPMFEQELDNQNIPLEIKYLAIVESALKPRARSRVGATGLWQFMYGTGKMFGLEVDSYVDERMDPIMATKAACKYLSKLYKTFGDWDLALASYNSGPGNVSKAIRRSGGYRNYWNIRHNLPRETAGYLPAFLATMYIFEYADKHGFKPRKPKFVHFETDTIKVKEMITLNQVSKYINVDIKELQFLNPSYKLDIIPKVKDEDYVLRLPLDHVGKFVSHEKQIYALAQEEFGKREKQLPQQLNAKNKIRYRVRRGDFLGKIARRYGVQVRQIKRWNNLRSNNLRIGQRLTIYRRAVASRAKPINKPSAKSKSVAGNSKLYTVKSGDTLWSISKKFTGVTIQNLKSWNRISGSRLKPGMKLKVSNL